MDNDLFEKGLEKRKATLGAEYVEKNLAAADDSFPDTRFTAAAPAEELTASDPATARTAINVNLMPAMSRHSR